MDPRNALANHHRRAAAGARWRARRARKFPKTESRIRFARRHAAARARSSGDAVATISSRLEPTTRMVSPASATRATSPSVASAFPPAISRRRARGTSKRRAHAFAVASCADFGTEIFHTSLPRLTRLCAFDAPATTASAASFRKGAAHAGQETCGASWRRRRWKGEWAIETLMVGSVDRRAFRRVDDDTAENTTRSRRRYLVSSRRAVPRDAQVVEPTTATLRREGLRLRAADGPRAHRARLFTVAHPARPDLPVVS